VPGVFGVEADPDPDPAPPVAAAATAAIAAECACPTDILFGGALETEAEIVRARYCGRAAFFGTGVLLPDEEPAAASGEDELLLKLGAAEEEVLATEPAVEAERREIAEAFLGMPPIPPAAPPGRLGVDVAFEGEAEIVDIEPDVDLDLVEGWRRLGLLLLDMVRLRVLLVEAKLSVRVLDADAVAAAITELIDEAPLSERFRPGSTRGGIGVVAGVGKPSMLWSWGPSSSGTLHKLLLLPVFFNCVLLVVLLGAERTLPMLPTLPTLPTLMMLSLAPARSSTSLLNGLGLTATIEVTELALLSPCLSASFSLSLASLAAFFLRPTELNCLVNGLGASSSSLSLHPRPVVSPIPPRRSLPSRWRTRRRVVSRSSLYKPDLVMLDAVETFEVIEAAEYADASDV
jgi:hypothetical protein